MLVLYLNYSILIRMKISHKISISFTIAFAVVLALSIDGRAQTIASTQKCFIISDVHFDPLFGARSDTALYTLLQRTPVSGWQKIFEASKAQTTISSALLGKDANYAVLRSSLSNMKQTLPNPAFIIIAGDFIWHGAKPQDSVLKRKSIRFVANMIKERFAGVTIIPTMGNNDTYGFDYALQDAAFRSDFAEAWQPNLPAASAAQLKGRGYYALNKGDMKFLVINTASCSLNSQYPTEAAEMLKWIAAELAMPSAKHVWLLMHIPPGLNGFNNKNMWNVQSAQTFVNTIVQYAAKVKLSIAAHTHFNDFKVFYDAAGKPASLMRIVPSICSNHGNNPSFEVAEYSTTTGNLLNESNYYLNLMQLPTNTNEYLWSDVLGSKQTLGLSKINAAALSGFIDTLNTAKTQIPLKAYMGYYNLNTPVDTLYTINTSNYKNYLKADSLKAVK